MDLPPFATLSQVTRTEVAVRRQVRGAFSEPVAHILANWARNCLGLAANAFDWTLESVDYGKPPVEPAESALEAWVINSSGVGVQLVIEDRLVLAIGQRLLGVAQGAAISRAGPGERGIAFYALGWLIGELSPSGSWALHDGVPSSFAPTDCYRFEFRVRVADRSGSCWAILGPNALAAWSRPQVISRTNNARLDGCFAEGVVELTRVHLTAPELDSLEQGDVVTVGVPGNRLADCALQLQFGRLTCSGAVRNGRSFLIRDIYGKRGHAMAQDAPNTTPPETQIGQSTPLSAQIAESVELEVTVEVARVKVPVADVLALAPGDIIPLGVEVGHSVELRLGERLIGRGDLVNIEGELGVRLLSVA